MRDFFAVCLFTHVVTIQAEKSAPAETGALLSFLTRLKLELQFQSEL